MKANVCRCGCGREIGCDQVVAKGHGRIRPDSDRFWERVDRRGPDDCWEWTAGRVPAGYGAIKLSRGPVVKAHRFSYELHKGPIPKGALILHSCDNPGCVNPAHLRAGTAKDNTADALHRKRLHAQLTEDDVRAIRRDRKSTPIAALADRFGVSESTISLVVNKKRWAHLA